LLADARALPYPNGFFQCIVTSPPYWGQRDYTDDPREIGAGSSQDYLAEMRACAREWWNKCDDRATLWLNENDTSSGSGGAGGDYNRGGTAEGKPKYRQGASDRPPMALMNMPHRVLEEFIAEGWLYRRTIIWAKQWDNGTPQLRRANIAHERRPGDGHEYIFMLTKGKKYYFDPDGTIEPGSVWHFSKELKNEAKHLAPFPEELPRRCILLSTKEGDRVLDPFSGSGTTVKVANALGRLGYGTDLVSMNSENEGGLQ
jgi:site-specific DNA-methyltransferase (cytosine-N4-specific)